MEGNHTAVCHAPTLLHLLLLRLRQSKNCSRIHHLLSLKQDALVKHWIVKTEAHLRRDKVTRQETVSVDSVADEIYVNQMNKSNKRTMSYHTAIKDFVI